MSDIKGDDRNTDTVSTLLVYFMHVGYFKYET